MITVQEYSRKRLRALGPHAIRLAEAEGPAPRPECADQDALGRVEATTVEFEIE